jgi:VWFA-related protein
MSTYTRLGCFLLASLVCTAAASAQQPAPGNQPGPGKVYLDVEVTMKSGPPVAGLAQQDFTLLDNKAPRAITSFQAFTGRNAPMEVVLLIDAVNDTAQDVTYERLQIDKFLRADGGNLAYPVSLAVFTDKGVRSVTNFALDGNALDDVLQKESVGFRDIGRDAGYWGATERLQLSLTALRQLAASIARLPGPGRKVVLWVSPGWPLLFDPNMLIDSKQQQGLFANLVTLSTALLRARITLYSVDSLGTGQSVLHATDYKDFLKGISKPSQIQVANLGLQVFAIRSGGLAFNSDNDIAAALEQCVADSAPYYEITFDAATSQRPDEYHQLEIQVAKPGLTARARQEYYAQPATRK